MKLTNIFTAICFSLVFFTACKKSENDDKNKNNNNNPLSATALKLVEGKWQLAADSGFTNYMGKDTTIDFYKDIDECKKDDFLTFVSNGTCINDENTNICTGHGQTQSGSWKLLENDTKLAIYDNNPDTSDLEISGNIMKLKTTWKSSAGNLVYETVTVKNIK